MSEIKQRHKKYISKEYPWRQVRDCVEGSDAIKRGKEVYLPMPSGMSLISDSVSTSRPTRSGGVGDLSFENMPWYHHNPAYRAYLQRALFPDITASISRGLSGVAKKGDIEINLPDVLENSINCDIVKLYYKLITEIIQVGKACVVADVRDDGSVNLVFYSAERNINWEYENINGEEVLTRAVFVEQFEDAQDEESKEKVIEYKFNDDGNACVQMWEDGVPVDEEIVIMRQGKVLNALPVFFIGSVDNCATPDILPLLGVSDVALTAYRKDADLSQAQYMTCNPTLFIYGINEDQRPQMVGSTVVVSISNPNAKAEYPATDTSALDHVSRAIETLYERGIILGAQILGVGKKSAESAEALSIRESASGASLLDIVNNCIFAMNDILNFVAEWMGINGEVVFNPSNDFVEHRLSPHEISALVGSWVQGAISHDTLLDNLRDANIVSGEVDNKEEKEKIGIESEEKFVMTAQGKADE